MELGGHALMESVTAMEPSAPSHRTFSTMVRLAFLMHAMEILSNITWMSIVNLDTILLQT